MKTHDRTLEKSADGDMTKLSLLFDQAIRFEMLGSSSMLLKCQREFATNDTWSAHLYNLCMKAVCTTFGCWEDVAAAALNPFAAGPF